MRFFVAAAGLRTRDRRVAGTAAKQSAHRLSRRRRRARGLFVRRLRGCAERSRAVRGVPADAAVAVHNSGVDGATPAQAEVGHAPEQRGRGRGRGRGPPSIGAATHFAISRGEDAVEGAPRGERGSPTPGRGRSPRVAPLARRRRPREAPPPPRRDRRPRFRAIYRSRTRSWSKSHSNDARRRAGVDGARVRAPGRRRPELVRGRGWGWGWGPLEKSHPPGALRARRPRARTRFRFRFRFRFRSQNRSENRGSFPSSRSSRCCGRRRSAEDPRRERAAARGPRRNGSAETHPERARVVQVQRAGPGRNRAVFVPRMRLQKMRLRLVANARPVREVQRGVPPGNRAAFRWVSSGLGPAERAVRRERRRENARTPMDPRRIADVRERRRRMRRTRLVGARHRPRRRPRRRPRASPRAARPPAQRRRCRTRPWAAAAGSARARRSTPFGRSARHPCTAACGIGLGAASTRTRRAPTRTRPRAGTSPCGSRDTPSRCSGNGAGLADAPSRRGACTDTPSSRARACANTDAP